MREFNILIDDLPKSVFIDGSEVEIETNFRTGILFEMMLNDDLSDEEKAINTLGLWYPGIDADPEFFLEHIYEAVDKIIWFYTGGDEIKGDEKQEEDMANKFIRRIYDFDVDAPMIYAAFLSQYRIDLQDVEYMHWWKFCALFGSLDEDQQITKIMSYRSVDLSTIKNKAEKDRLFKLQAKYALPNRMTVEQKAAAVGEVFRGLMG